MANEWTGSSTNTYNYWFADTSNYPGYLGVNSKLVVSTSQYPKQSLNGDNPYGIAVGVRTSDTLQNAIGISSCSVNDRNGMSSTNYVWGLICEIQHSATGLNGSCGIELALKNTSGINNVTNPYTLTTNAVIGILIASGGDPAFGGAANAPVDVGIIFSSGPNFAVGALNSGIQFRSGSLMSSNGWEAISFAVNHTLRWYEPSGGKSGEITCSNGTPSTSTKINIGSSSIALQNNSGSSMFNVVGTATSYTRLQVQTNSSLQDNIILASLGATGTDVDFAITPQNSVGNGRVRFGTYVNTPSAVTGYIEIKDIAGNIRKLAVIS
jgi:hypothetical protein